MRCPSRRVVYNNVRKYAITGASLNLNKGQSGRNKTARSAENIETVRNAIEEARGKAPEIRISCRRNGLGLSSAAQQKRNNLFWPDENSNEQCFAAHIVQGCQQYCSTLLSLN